MISKEYLSQLKQIFQDKTRPNGFGGKIKKLGKFHDYMNQWKPNSLLDYGCGKGIILEHLQYTYPTVLMHGYDPAVFQFSNIKFKNYDCVFSNDVLEHVEPEFIDNVLAHINTLAQKFVWLRIDTEPARKTLPDGRNAHILLESDIWWKNKIEKTINGKIVFSELHKGKFDVAIEK